jgi:hypothetical protein
MTLSEIKEAVDAGSKVYYKNESYVVEKDRGGYDIVSLGTGHRIGLVWMDGMTMNGEEEDFFVKVPDPITSGTGTTIRLELDCVLTGKIEFFNNGDKYETEYSADVEITKKPDSLNDISIAIVSVDVVQTVNGRNVSLVDFDDKLRCYIESSMGEDIHPNANTVASFVQSWISSDESISHMQKQLK